jgi:hypothetical protein
MFFCIMAFCNLLKLLSDYDTVVLKGAKLWCVDCSCQVLSLQLGIAKGQCTLKTLWLAQRGNYPLAPPIHNIGISNGPSRAKYEKT